MARTVPHVLYRNDRIVMTFPSQILAEEALADVGCYTEPPEPGDVIGIMPLDDFRELQAPVECDVCQMLVDHVNRRVVYGIETMVCDHCLGIEDDEEDEG